VPAAASRVAFGRTLAEQGTIRADIANSRIEIEQARLLTLSAAYKMDAAGNKAARGEIAMIKIVAPNMALRVIDRAIQAHGAAGSATIFPLPTRGPARGHYAWRTDPTRCIGRRSLSWNWSAGENPEAEIHPVTMAPYNFGEYRQISGSESPKMRIIIGFFHWRRNCSPRS